MKKFMKFMLFLFLVAIAYGIFSGDDSGSSEPEYDFVIQNTTEVADTEVAGEPEELELILDYGEALVEMPEESLLWGYQQLTAEEQTGYITLRDAVAAYSEQKIPMNISYHSLERVLDAINYDLPELFWFDGSLSYYTDADGDTVSFVELEYNMPKEELERAQIQIESYIAGCLASESMVTAQSDFARVVAVYRYLVDHTEYDIAYQEQQSVVSLMKEGKAVCRGYAESFALIMHRLNIPCTIVEGLSSQDWVLSDQGHAWNAVMLDGQWYNIDPTWGDPLYQEGADSSAPVDGYILVNDELFDRDHVDFSELGSPVCTAMDLNYYAVFGLLHSVWNEDYFRWAVQSHLDLGLDWAQVRYDNYEAYYQAKAALIDGGVLGDIVVDLGFGKQEGDYISWTYNCDDITGVIMVKLIY